MGALSLALAVPSGCVSFTNVGAARTVDRGTTQVYTAPEVSRISRGGRPLVTPQVEFGLRHGVSDRVEFGARVWMPNIAVDAKVQLLRAATPDSGFDLAIDPTIGYLGGFSGTESGEGDTLHVLTIAAPLLVGWNVGRGNQLVVSARLVDQVWFGTGNATTTANLLYAGGSLGFVWKVTDGFRLMPEIGFGAPFVQTLTHLGTDVGLGGFGLQLGLGFLFGGDAPKDVKCR